MKNLKTNLLKGALALSILFIAGTGITAEAKAKPKLSSKKITINVGQKKKLKVKNFKKKKKIKWSSKNSKIATVNKKGKVVGKKKGKTTIIAKVGNKKLKCKVVVKKAKSKKNSSNKKANTNKKIKLNKQVKKQLTPAGYLSFSCPETLSMGTSTDLFKFMYYGGQPYTSPSANVKAKYFKWSSSNSSIVSIDKYGVATAHKEGKVKISLKYVAKNGEWVDKGDYTIAVKNVGNVTYTVAYGLNKDWVDLSPEYYEGNFERMNTPGAFNYVNVTVTNNSDTEIVVSNKFGLQMGSWKNWTTRDNQSVTIPAKSSKTILYRLTEKGGVRLQKEIYRLSFGYSINGKEVGIYYYPDSNSYELSA